MDDALEYNFDGIVGPTHNYAGLSYGNVASTTHRSLTSSPKEAALQGLKKMKFLHGLGLPQAVLPPHERPHLPTLGSLGFTGDDATVLGAAAATSQRLLAAVSSASAMWTANAATVAPSADASDGKVHFTPANLVAKLHRSIEPRVTARVLQAIFKDPSRFAHHAPLPATESFGDEGAANHTRLSPSYGRPGVHLFVYGRQAFAEGEGPRRFPARQTFEASQAVARLHKLAPSRVVFAQQRPEAIDRGVFHNDVICVGNRKTLFFHENAFVDSKEVTTALKDAFRSVSKEELEVIVAPEREVPLDDVVRSYLFNSQLVTLASGETALIAPSESRETKSVKAYLDKLVLDRSTSLRSVHYLDLRQSMNNGGGPACLRLRVWLTDAERRAALPGVFFSDALYDSLVAWVEKHYRDRLEPKDLADPALLRESRTALDELTRLLGLGSVYDFQLCPGSTHGK